MFVVSGCADNYSGNTYQSNRAGIVQKRQLCGTVTNIRQVNIQDDSSNMPIGAVAGAVVGGLLGHAVGGGTGKKLATWVVWLLVVWRVTRFRIRLAKLPAWKSKLSG